MTNRVAGTHSSTQAIASVLMPRNMGLSGAQSKALPMQNPFTPDSMSVFGAARNVMSMAPKRQQHRNMLAPGYDSLAAFGGPTKAAANHMNTGNDVEAMKVAGQAIGLNEGQQKAALTEYLRNGGQNLDPATTAWCAAFVNSTLAQSGQEGTGSLAARSFLDWGEPVDTPQRGDVAVFSRGDPNGWQGHVGFYHGQDEAGNILVLGGNQGDAVSVAPYSPDRLLGYRRPNPFGG